VLKIAPPEKPHLNGLIPLAGSKSISNRVLILRALCREEFPISGLSSARDTRVLQQLLNQPTGLLDAGPAGTTFRFLTAYLSLQPGTQLLTGSDRMKQRPIGILVNALRQLGAPIEYLEKEGYPPLRIGEMPAVQTRRRLRIPASTSSQFISALLLIGPALPHGLQLELTGPVVSRPYIQMTLRLIRYFGAQAEWTGNRIDIPPSEYQPRAFQVEADWSAASYYYAMAVIAQSAELQLNGLFADSLQGDAVLAELMEPFGVQTHFNPQGIRLVRHSKNPSFSFVHSFLECPDLAQTLAVCCAAAGRPARLEGLRTLRIKETDRVAALMRELERVGVRSRTGRSDGGDEWLELEGRAQIPETPPCFDTYEDHRMAMALAPLALLGEICLREPEVVQKSYPEFWDHLEGLGFRLHWLSGPA